MKKWIMIDLLIFLVLGGLALTFAPDVFSLVVTAVMCMVVAVAFSKGIWMVLSLADAFRTGSKYIDSVKNVTSVNRWSMFRQAEAVFQYKLLDSLWGEYLEVVDAEQRDGLVCSDLEDTISEEILALHTWKSVIHQIPGSLTALGLLGTFLGLILGISGIAFSSVDAAISSITMLLAGIETAFYTSIIGVIFSMFFNISYKLAWNALLREMGLFMTEFHKQIFADESRQQKQADRADIERIMECLERIPKGGDYFFTGTELSQRTKDDGNETILMSEIWEGLKNEDFIFYIQPRCDLNSKEITGGEVLMRWNHKTLGIVSPTVFLPTLERNGYIVKLDCRMWEDVCKMIRHWLDEQIRPVPISVNVSRMDILAMDVADYFAGLVRKYQIPPQYLQIELAENAYTQSYEMAHETEDNLRQEGFQVIINGGKGQYDTMSILAGSHADALKMEFAVLNNRQTLNSAVIAELVEQGRKSRVRMIASGIENVKLLTMLRKAGFSEGQGFFLYKPVDVERFEDLLKAREIINR